MSTRASIHFSGGDGEPEAIVYRHSDGYPDGLGADLIAFFDEIDEYLTDNRYNDPSYLAAKWIVYDARKHTQDVPVWDSDAGEMKYEDRHYLDFLSVGITLQDAGDADYKYVVHCYGVDKNKRPRVTIEDLVMGEEMELGKEGVIK